MPIKISQQEVAERILDILVIDLKLKPGDVVPDQQLKLKYREGNGDSGDIQHGMAYAGDQEWLEYHGAPENNWTLTALGHESFS